MGSDDTNPDSQPSPSHIFLFAEIGDAPGDQSDVINPNLPSPSQIFAAFTEKEDALREQSDETNPDLRPKISHAAEISDGSAGESEEKETWMSANQRASVISTIDHDPNLYQSTASNPVGSGLRPGSVGSNFPPSLRTSQIDSRRVSRRSYMEDYPEFDAALEEELYNGEGDDDDDMLSISNSKKKFSLLSLRSISTRGILNLGALLLLVFGLIAIFVILPIVSYLNSQHSTTNLSENSSGYNLGGTNSSGQVPVTRR